MLMEVFALWEKKSSKNEIIYYASPKTTVQDLKMKLKKTLDGLEPEKNINIVLFYNKQKRSNRSPDLKIYFRI